MEPDLVIAYLNNLPRLFEAAHVTTFKCYRQSADGRTQEVTVEIHDAGPRGDPEAYPPRYRCIARSDDGKTASGNSADRIDVVLATLHWQDLD
jgi:ketosteroid isomerase-like protein